MEKTLKKIQLLDCTLRDGGSLLNWDFPHKTVRNIIQGLNDSKIDLIEAGFLQNNKFEMEYYENLFSNIKNKTIKTALMIDYGHYDIKKVNNNSLIDLIRIMFKKHQIKDALKYAEKLLDKGYKISLNPVSVTAYTKSDIADLCIKVNSLPVEIVYIIDTYGLLDNEKAVQYLNYFDNNLNPNIKIGFHAHNNRQLAFANSLEIINNTGRDIVIDGSLYGMGKRAGNMPVELFIQYMNNNYNTNYNLNEIIKLIETEIIPLKGKYEWGYNLNHYIASVNGCHSDYVTYLAKEKKLSYKEINLILLKIKEDKKLTFDKAYIESIYKEIK